MHDDELTRLDGHLALVAGSAAGPEIDQQGAGVEPSVARASTRQTPSPTRTSDRSPALALAIDDLGGRLNVIISTACADNYICRSSPRRRLVRPLRGELRARATRDLSTSGLPRSIRVRIDHRRSSVETFRAPFPHCAAYAAHKSAVVNFASSLETQAGPLDTAGSSFGTPGKDDYAAGASIRESYCETRLSTPLA